MFREMRRKKQQVSLEECECVLRDAPRGVLAVFGEDGYPYAIPMNHFYFDGKIYFHSAKVGHKLDAILQNDKVSFCIMDEGFKKEGHWALHITSVVVFGSLKRVESEKSTMEILQNLARKHFPSEEEVLKEMRKYSKEVQMLELEIHHMTGKLVKES